MSSHISTTRLSTLPPSIISIIPLLVYGWRALTGMLYSVGSTTCLELKHKQKLRDSVYTTGSRCQTAHSEAGD